MRIIRKARSIVRGVAMMQGDQVLTDFLALLDQKPAEVRALGWLGIVNLSRDRSYRDDETRLTALTRVIGSTVDLEGVPHLEELLEDVRSSMLAATCADSADTDPDVPEPAEMEFLRLRARYLERLRANAGNMKPDRTVEAKAVWKVAIDKLMRINDWDLVSQHFSSGGPGKHLPSDTSQAAPPLNPSERETVEILLQSWSTRFRNGKRNGKDELSPEECTEYARQISERASRMPRKPVVSRNGGTSPR